jgi:hypothetical protein
MRPCCAPRPRRDRTARSANLRNSPTVDGSSQEASFASHEGFVKWCKVTTGSIPVSRSVDAIRTYRSIAFRSHSPRRGATRLHSTENR